MCGRLYKRKAGKGEFGHAQPATQAISFKVVYVPVDHPKKWLLYFHFFFVCLFLYNITKCDSYRF